MVEHEGSVPEWPDDDRNFPDDEKLPWAREVLRQNFVDPEPDATESADEFRARLRDEAADRGWEIDSAEKEGGAYVIILRNATLTAEGRDLRGYGASIDDALMVALADAISLDNE